MSNYPDTKPGDVRQALRMAWGSSDPTIGARRAVALSLVAGIFVAGGLLFFLTESGGLSGGSPPVAVIIGVVAAAVGLFAIVKRSRE
jgi:formate/nitrite transporter FocA (FNT family)